MTKIIAIAALLLVGCVGPAEMLACGKACEAQGSTLKKLDWKGQCECYAPPQKEAVCK